MATFDLKSAQHAFTHFPHILYMPAIYEHVQYAHFTHYMFTSPYHCIGYVQVCTLKNFHGRKVTCNATSVYKPATTNNILLYTIITYVAYLLVSDINMKDFIAYLQY